MSDDYYLTEQEQIQQLKNWLKQYGSTILAGILLALAVTSGWHYWQNHRNQMLLRASHIYDVMLTSRAQNNIEDATAQAKQLVYEYPKTPYAQMAAFLLAQDLVSKRDFTEAAEKLQWVIDHSNNNAIQQIARIRKARALIADQKPDAALEFLQKTSDALFIGLIDEVRGDAYLAKNNQKTAREAYGRALEELPDSESERPILQMKYDDLAPVENTPT